MRKLLTLLLVLIPLTVLAQSGTPPGAYGPGGSGSGGGVPNLINPTQAPYNAPTSSACANLNVTLTSGSNVVGCSTASFTSADIGKVIWASCCGGLGGQSKSSSVLVVAQGVIHDVISGTSVHVCTTTGTCTPVNSTANSANGTLLYWGFKADTQLAAAITAAYSGPTPCSQLYWAGFLMVSSGKGNAAASCIHPIGATFDTNLSMEGSGRANSVLLMSPDFDFTTGVGNSCGGLSGTGTHNVCFFAQQGMERKYFGINGGGRSNTGGNAVIILDSEVDDFDFDVGLSDIGAQDSSMVCYEMDGSGAYPNFVEVDGCGAVPISVASGTANTLINGFAADVKGPNTSGNGGCMQVLGGATVNTYGMYFGPANSAGSAQCVNVTGTWNSNGDTCISGAGTNCVFNNGGTIHISNFSNPTDFSITADRAVVSTVAGSKTYITNSSLFGTVNPVLLSAGADFRIDDKTTFAGGGSNSGLAPTISSGFGTTPSIASGLIPQSFRVNVGTGGTATSGVVGLPPALTGWNCQVQDMTTNVATRQTASTTTTATLTAAAAWTASDILQVGCSPF